MKNWTLAVPAAVALATSAMPLHAQIAGSTREAIKALPAFVYPTAE